MMLCAPIQKPRHYPDSLFHLSLSIQSVCPVAYLFDIPRSLAAEYAPILLPHLRISFNHPSIHSANISGKSSPFQSLIFLISCFVPQCNFHKL